MILQCVYGIWIEYTLQKVHKDVKVSHRSLHLPWCEALKDKNN
jgi:hypothetical protein